MNQASEQITEADIQAYVDGCLDESKLQQMEMYLQDNPSEAQRVEVYKQQNEIIKSVYGELEQTDIIGDRMKSYQQGRPQFMLYVASIVWGVMGCIFGWYLHDYTEEQTNLIMSLPNRAAVAHAVYVPEVIHPVEVVAEEEEHLVKWLSKRLDTSIKTPDLRAAGFDLVGGRLLPSDSGPAAQFMYENSTGERLTLYVVADQKNKKESAFRYFESQGINVFYWVDSNMGFAISGEIDKEDLMEAAKNIYQQLSV